MKSNLLKGILISLIVFLIHINVSGQKGRFGNTPEDSARCVLNLVMYGDKFKQGNYEEAYPLWRVVCDICPQATVNTFRNGERIMDRMILNAKSEEEKKNYLDTAMVMFDRRIEFFGDEENVLGRKGIFWFRYNNNTEEAEPGYNALKKAIELSGDNPSDAVVATFMHVTVAKFNAGLIDNEQVIETYSSLIETIDKSTNDALHNIRGTVESLFADSGAADCDALENLFTDQVENSPDGIELLMKVNDLLTSTRCTESNLYLTVAEKIHEIDPSPRSALSLSAMYKKRENNSQVTHYLEQAVDLQEDPVERSSYLLELAFLADQDKKDKQLSRRYALEALEDNPNLGRAHLHIGSLYAAEKNCFNDPFKDRTVFWVAVDRFNEAKKVDPSLANEADRFINLYSGYFPDNETIFFNGLSAGETYRVECWINESTRIRAK
ncbi:MAG: tetratricopeptide repeat protein [Bacteroidales bacterium]